MLEILAQLSLLNLIVLSLLINIVLFFCSMALYTVVSKFSKQALIQENYQSITKSDIGLSLIVLVCNSAVFVLGETLWEIDIIKVEAAGSFSTVLFQVIVLILAMDFLMYVFHRIAHLPILYTWVHGKHHEHTSVNSLSLFVLHPIEAIGFGLLFIVVLMLYSFNVWAITVYLIVNLIWGTIGHLNQGIFKENGVKKWISKVFCLSLFHNRHHQYPNCNYGFYTLFWDKLFNTYRVEN